MWPKGLTLPLRPKVVWHPHPAPRPPPVARRPLQLRFLRFFCAIFFRGPPSSRPRPSSGAPVPLAVWSPTRPESASGRAAGRAPWRPRERPVCGAPMEHVQSKYLGLGFVLSRARPIASAPGPFERVCGERFGCPPAPSQPPKARSVGCPGCRVGALFVVHVVKFMSIHIRSSCVFLRLFVVL